jgi:hypothetical protein
MELSLLVSPMITVVFAVPHRLRFVCGLSGVYLAMLTFSVLSQILWSICFDGMA